MKRIIWVLGMLSLGFGVIVTTPRASVADHHACRDHECSFGSQCPSDLGCTACLPQKICGPAVEDDT